MFEHLINHIIEQRNKQQYLNAIASAIELQSVLLREFSDLQKGKPANTGLHTDIAEASALYDRIRDDIASAGGVPTDKLGNAGKA